MGEPKPPGGGRDSRCGNLPCALVDFSLDDILKDTVVQFARVRFYVPTRRDWGEGMGHSS